jgi:GNAT superfamily N-acetyltransferase
MVMKIYETLESGIKIVEYEPRLAESLAEMWNLSNDDWGGRSSLRTASQIINQHETASHFNSFVAMDGDIAVGYCSFGRYFGDANTLFIPLLGVRPDYQNKKIGKALVLQCVKRTIELNYPRLDLFTWPGNTSAMPLYKKCGFMWEDMPGTTHLSNYIPAILTTPLFAEFFTIADWYAHSTRGLEILPDGVETNKFESLNYTWEKDGHMLAVGFERTGRQMRMIETDDYKIELMAHNHVLAFGLEYDCVFTIENKTGKELNIKINGKDEKNIRFNYSLDTQVTGRQEFHAKFYVGEVDEIQSEWKVHPCLLADVEINGHAVTFGLGIETRFPIGVNLTSEHVVAQVGTTVTTYINISSSLYEDAEVTLKIPENRLISISENPFTVNIPAKGRTSVKVMSTTLGIGFEPLKLECAAVLQNGAEFTFKTPLDLYMCDMTHAFSGADLYNYIICNGPWNFCLNKNENEGWVSHLTNGDGYGWFMPPKFGKPYDDEFTLIKPNVKMYSHGTVMILEAEYVSEKFPGMAVTQIYTLTASGLVTRANKIENRAVVSQQFMLQDEYYFGLGDRTIFSYKGEIVQNHSAPKVDTNIFGFNSVNPDYFDENWVFEASPANPKGYCWPGEYKPSIRWGSNITFEIAPGILAPGEVFETKPIIYTLGMFSNYNDFRNFARGSYNREVAIPSPPIEITLNKYNPFITETDTTLEVINNREQILGGTITVSSENLFETATNPTEERVERNVFDISLNKSENIAVAKVALNTTGFEKDFYKAIFFPCGEITKTRNENMYTVSNGEITFKANPSYGNVCYSLTDAKSREWLLNQYPEHKPFAYWSPFFGGIGVTPPGMDNAAVLKEKITADFAQARDNFGNVWEGICLTTYINEYEWLKGSAYKAYFVTLPGLPLLCSFFQFENNTGEFRQEWVSTTAYFNPDENIKNVFVEMTDEHLREYRIRMGAESRGDTRYQNTAVIKSSRNESLYLFHCNKNNGKSNTLWGNNKIAAEAIFSMSAYAENGGIFTSSPSFYIITGKNLPPGSLDVLEKINFSLLPCQN